MEVCLSDDGINAFIEKDFYTIASGFCWTCFLIETKMLKIHFQMLKQTVFKVTSLIYKRNKCRSVVRNSYLVFCKFTFLTGHIVRSFFPRLLFHDAAISELNFKERLMNWMFAPNTSTFLPPLRPIYSSFLRPVNIIIKAWKPSCILYSWLICS